MQEEIRNTLYRYIFADCLKCQFSISISEEMVGLFDFPFVCRSFFGVRHSNNIKKSDIKIFNLVPYLTETYENRLQNSF